MMINIKFKIIFDIFIKIFLILYDFINVYCLYFFFIRNCIREIFCKMKNLKYVDFECKISLWLSLNINIYIFM